MELNNPNHEKDASSESTTSSNGFDILAGPETPLLKPIRDVVEGITFMDGELKDIRKIVQIIKHMDPDLLKEHRALEKEVKDLSLIEATRSLSKYVKEQTAKIEQVKSGMKYIEWCQYEAWTKGVAVVPTIDWQYLSRRTGEPPLPSMDYLALYTSHAEAMRVVFRDPSITLENTFRFFRSRDPIVPRVLPLIQAVVTLHAHLRTVDRRTHDEHLQSAATAARAMKSVVERFDIFIDRYEAAYDAHEAYVQTLKKQKRGKARRKSADDSIMDIDW